MKNEDASQAGQVEALGRLEGVGFTPGPWSKDKYGRLVGSNGETVCVWDAGIAHVQRSRVAEANARIIAAAPEMYEALKIVTDTLAYLRGEETIKRARAALKAARGE